MKIVAALPTYNEAENIPTMIEALRALPVPDLSFWSSTTIPRTVRGAS